MTGWEAFAFNFLNPRIAAEYAPAIIAGLGVTILLAMLIIASGLVLGLALAVLRAFAIRPVNWAIIFVVDLFRALPPLVIIVLIYFGLPAAGLSMSGFWATWLALTLVLMAFAEEIFWAGISAVPQGQWEAGRALGLHFLPTLRKIVLPQAVRIAIPPLVNRTIAITKGTALGSVVAVSEILGAAQSGMAFSGNPTPLTLGAIAYIVLFIPVVMAGRWIETPIRVAPMSDFVQAFLNAEIALASSHLLWIGLVQTMLLALMTVPLGMVAGLVMAVLSTRKSRWVRWPLVAFIDFFRAIPPLVLLIFLYAALPFGGVDLGAWGSVALAFLLNTGAYYAEILRAGIESVPKGQAEAARALGLKRWQVWIFVVLPQAVRNVLPDLISNTLEVVKLTSIASVVAVPELLYQARQAQSITYNATPIMVAAVIYFLLLWPCVRLLSRLENRQIAGRR